MSVQKKVQTIEREVVLANSQLGEAFVDEARFE
jgi:hypothetical protein